MVGVWLGASAPLLQPGQRLLLAGPCLCRPTDGTPGRVPPPGGRAAAGRVSPGGAAAGQGEPPRLCLSPSPAESRHASTRERGNETPQAPGDPARLSPTGSRRSHRVRIWDKGGGRASPGTQRESLDAGASEPHTSVLLCSIRCSAEVGRRRRWDRGALLPSDAGRGRTALGPRKAEPSPLHTRNSGVEGLWSYPSRSARGGGGSRPLPGEGCRKKWRGRGGEGTVWMEGQSGRHPDKQGP